jgi:CubicO group peptidase (beta-lactamase class C family)
VAKFLPAFGKVRVLTGTTLSDAHEVDLIRPVALHDLLTHTAGLTYNFLEDSPVSELYRQARLFDDADRALEAMIGELLRLPLAYQPGTKWHYSMAIDVIAHLIEVISCQPLQDFLQERIFVPWGMTDTGFSVPPHAQHRIATMYGHPDIATHTFGILMAQYMHDFELPEKAFQSSPIRHWLTKTVTVYTANNSCKRSTA